VKAKRASVIVSHILLLTAILSAALTPGAAAAASKFRILHDFTGGDDGGGPVLLAALAIDSGGNLYGAGGGGSERNCDGYGCGVIFEMVRQQGSKWAEVVLYNFASLKNADSPLALDSQGNLYGCTGDYGPMFELKPGSAQWNFNSIWPSGCIGEVGLILDGVGNLYGEFGNGTTGGVSELSPSPNGWIYTNLYEFCPSGWNCRDGQTPEAPFSWDAKGNLYGTTYSGGLVNYPDCGGYCGVAFQMTPNGDGTWAYHVMHRFSGHDGCDPYGSLTVDAQGSAYGTGGCGRTRNGVVFRLSQTSRGQWRETLIYDFGNGNNGFGPESDLVLDKHGNIYGIANSSACNGACGLAFKLGLQKNGRWKYTVLHQFNGTDGDLPNGLTMDRQGNLFGTTTGGGTYGYGVVFEITP